MLNIQNDITVRLERATLQWLRESASRDISGFTGVFTVTIAVDGSVSVEGKGKTGKARAKQDIDDLDFSIDRRESVDDPADDEDVE